MKTVFKTFIIVGSLVFMFGVDFVGETPSRLVFVKDAQAIIGMPFTPMSYAGVARRTTRRVVATEAAVATTAAVAAASKPPPPPPSTTVVVVPPSPAAPAPSGVPIGTVVQALPAGCKSVVVSGVTYSDCAGVFYKPAFQGNNLVYVVVPSPVK
jgi:hypothetical protein